MFRPNVPVFLTLGVVAAGAGGGTARANDAGPPADFDALPGLVYSEPHGGLTLDLFLPRPAQAPVPCVLVIQGGGFRPRNGHKFRPFAVYLAQHGFAAALISYRGWPDHHYRDTIADTKAAVRFVRRIAPEHNIDPDRIGAMGRSAGGALSALLAVTGGVDELEGAGGHADRSSRIQAAVAYAGVFDFVARFTDERHMALQPGLKRRKELNTNWIGVPFDPDNEHWRRASAVTHVDAGDPPMLLLHCRDDATVPWPQTEDMRRRLQAAGVPVEVRYFETGGHGFGGLSCEDEMAPMVAFFKKTLR